MSFNTPALLTAMDAILTAVTGVQDSHIGVPGVFEARASAYCCVSGQDFPGDLQAMGGASYGEMTRVARILVGFAYATGATTTDPTDRAAIATAELTIAGWVDAFARAVLTDAPLKALCEDLSVDLSLNDIPDYRNWAGREVRHVFCIVSCQQSESV